MAGGGEDFAAGWYCERGRWRWGRDGRRGERWRGGDGGIRG
jgi:hypothetical protein